MPMPGKLLTLKTQIQQAPLPDNLLKFSSPVDQEITPSS